jgi:hypothetical protein
MASHVIVQEIINDIIAIDPELKNIKSELEKLVQELIANKPQTPFTKEFKESLKAQIIGAINEQKILYEEKKRDRNDMFHSIKFWMVGISTVTAGLLMFTLFHYIEDIQQPATQITYTQTYSDLPIGQTNLNESASNEISKQTIKEQPIIKDISKNEQIPTESFGGGASNSADNVMMLPIPETTLEPEMRSFSMSDEPVTEYAMMKATTIEEDTDLAFCETSKQFLLANNISENTTKTFTYNNQIYKATINFTNNSINIDHIGTQDDSKIQTELPNLNLFFEKNNFNIKSDYLSPIIEETDTYIEYYFPRNNKQEGITAYIDTTTNIIYSIQSICIY